MGRALYCLCICLQGVWALDATPKFKDPKSIIDGKFNTKPLDGSWNTQQCAGHMVESGFELKICYREKRWDQLMETHPDKPCIAYDLGVRNVADFSLAFLERFHCNVRAYDPSKVAAEWYDQNVNSSGAGLPAKDAFGKAQRMETENLRAYHASGRFTLHKEAAGDRDGDLTLYAFNNEQVSAVRATEETRDKQQAFSVKSRTLPSMMKDNGDTYIDVLKIDIGGSEFSFLNSAFDLTGCPPVEHILVEWHCEEKDMDFNIGAGQAVLDLEKRMKKCGFNKYATSPFHGLENPGEREGFVTTPLYYGHACYCRTCTMGDSEM